MARLQTIPQSPVLLTFSIWVDFRGFQVTPLSVDFNKPSPKREKSFPDKEPLPSPVPAYHISFFPGRESCTIQVIF